MANTNVVEITTPTGRLVMGSLYKPFTTDVEGRPLVVKNGVNAGQPRVQYFFGLAIPKGAEAQWFETEWGKQIVGVGFAAFPQAAKTPSFAWKVIDGDSAVPNKSGRTPNAQEGNPGHWILRLSSGFAPKVYESKGANSFTEMPEGTVKPGYYLQARISATGNDSTQQPGIYLNCNMVCFRGYGPEITFGANPEDAGFGTDALPAGATTAPAPVALPATPAPAPVASLPALPQAGVTPMPSILSPTSAVAAPAPTIPAATATPAPAPRAPATASPSSGRRMTAAANGVSYEAHMAAGWTDAQLIQHGLMTP
jgi:hypothetical protein